MYHQLIAPSGKKTILHLNPADPDRLTVRIVPLEIGNHKIHVRFNAVEIPQSPLQFEVCDDCQSFAHKLPVFSSDASKITYRGIGIQSISLHDKNEFYVDASRAGNNILFIGVCGPRGQCEEVAVKHLGQNNYYVTYRVQDPGQYLIAVKWGDEHVPNSPFSLETN
ncbi:hypothetical protein HA402_009056 [Bradysia odoriphaga]|nr:hypothetical protein HA402_009056 [Bradysia odoriphaga]